MEDIKSVYITNFENVPLLIRALYDVDLKDYIIHELSNFEEELQIVTNKT